MRESKTKLHVRSSSPTPLYLLVRLIRGQIKSVKARVRTWQRVWRASAGNAELLRTVRAVELSETANRDP